jgi:Rrf2 family protein
MRITYKGDYALKSLLYLAVHYGKRLVTIHEMSEHLDIPVKFLEQILLDLKRGRFVESRRGKVGGYLMARDPSRLKLGEAIRFVAGPIEPIACAGPDNKYKGCKDIYKCAFRKVWRAVTKATSDIIDEMTFEELASQIRAQEKTAAYQI